jgi:hypothetical protein
MFFVLTNKRELMCYNCGCQLPDDDQGKGHAGVDPGGKAITNKTFEAAGEAFVMESDLMKKNAHDLITREMETTEDDFYSELEDEEVLL